MIRKKEGRKKHLVTVSLFDESDEQKRRHLDRTHRYQLWVDAQVLPVATAHIGQQAAGRKRVQKVANARPGRVAGAAEVGGDGVVHSVDILLLQVGSVRVAGGQRGGARPAGLLTVAGRGKGWRDGACRRER